MDKHRRWTFVWLAASVAAVAFAALLMLAGAASAGIDADGNLDILFANNDRNRVCLGDGSGGFVCNDVSADANNTRRVAVGDVNEDGDLDGVFANFDSQRNRVCLGDGSGGFVCNDVSADSNNTVDVEVGDLDRDGNLDVVFANRNQRNRVCLGDGSGGFVCNDVSADSNDSVGVRLGDVDGDSNLDVVFANIVQRNRVCLGDGSGGFVCNDVSADANRTVDAAVGNVDGDGNLDVVFANTDNERNRVCLGDGSGGFTCSDVSTDADNSNGAAEGDVDGDGNLDVVFANWGGGERNRVCFGDGSGSFACSDVGTDTNQTADVAVGDVNRDGDVDAVFANATAERNRVCLGDGLGGFSCSDVSADGVNSPGVALAPGHRGRFSDDDFNIFEDDIEWMADQGITLGCNPEGTLYCPIDSVTRAQMASFLVRALDLLAVAGNRFSDVSGTHTANINALAEAGVTLGCNADGTLFCPDDRVTREQMGSFLARALELPPVAENRFTDVSGGHTANINAIAEAGITLGCNPAGTLYCPRDFVTRGQMAAFLHRALG